MAPKPLVLPNFNCTDDFEISVEASTDIVPKSNTATEAIILPEFVHLNVTTHVSYTSRVKKHNNIDGYYTKKDFDVSDFRIFSKGQCRKIASRIIGLVEIPFPISKNLRWGSLSFDEFRQLCVLMKKLKNRAEMIMEIENFVQDLGCVYHDLDAKNVLTINLRFEKIIKLPAQKFDALRISLEERSRTDENFAEEFHELTRARPMRVLEGRIRAVEQALEELKKV